jgi:hypothetical protein
MSVHFSPNEVFNMARNTGRGSRIGSVKNRTQVQNPKTGRFIKRDTETGQFINQKSDVKPFKGVAKEKAQNQSVILKSPITQKFIERFAGSIPDFPEVEKLDVQERDTW